jgi:hypothetical protein
MRAVQLSRGIPDHLGFAVDDASAKTPGQSGHALPDVEPPVVPTRDALAVETGGHARPFVLRNSAAPLAITSDSHTRDSTQGRRRMRGE